jgi:hypothetical protein
VPLHHRDFDQAARYLRYAAELLKREAPDKSAALCKMLEGVAQRLSTGDSYAGDLSAEIELLRAATGRLKTIKPGGANAQMEILKAVSVLRDGRDRR